MLCAVLLQIITSALIVPWNCSSVRWNTLWAKNMCSCRKNLYKILWLILVKFVKRNILLTMLFSCICLQIQLHDQQEIPAMKDLGIATAPGLHALMSIYLVQVSQIHWSLGGMGNASNATILQTMWSYGVKYVLPNHMRNIRAFALDFVSLRSPIVFKAFSLRVKCICMKRLENNYCWWILSRYS